MHRSTLASGILVWIALYSVAVVPSFAQSSFRLWGLAYFGDQGSGNVFSVDPDGTKFLRAKSFPKAEGINPGGKLLKASDGAWYGVSTNGGFGFGVIFKMNAAGSGYSVVYSFVKTDGANPVAGVREGLDGFLYGATRAGGGSNAGVLFKVKKDGSGFQKLIDFSGTNGSLPVGSPILTSDGNVYGVTGAGGVNSAGILYKIKADGTGFLKLVDFNYATAGNPISGLLQASDGNLYGLTDSGGTYGSGVVYKLQLSNGAYTNVLDLNFSSSGGAWADLIQGTDSKLYGVKSLGPVFSLNLNGTAFTLINDFSNEVPAGYISQMSTGDIVGLTQLGGAFGQGMIYKLNATGYTKILDLDYSTGQSSNYDLQSAITEVSPSAMTVLANGGGPSGNGAIFTYTSGVYNQLKGFVIEAQSPRAELIKGADGALYGVAEFGGSGAGSIFKITTDGTYTKLFQFDRATSGANPRGRLVQNSAGVLFGTTNAGGTGNTGTIFKLNTDGAGFTKLFDFDDFNSVSANGRFAEGGLVLASDNNLYGVCSSGGIAQNGTLYKIQQDGNGFSKLYDFTNPAGSRPFGNLLQASNGDLYGVTRNGGANNKGAIYKITLAGAYTKLLDFDGANGTSPTAGLVQGSDGLLYGTTWLGGSNNVGTVFKIGLDGSNFSKLVDFDDTKGSELLRSTLTEAPDGFLYGMASAGGANGVGTIFKVKKDGTSFAKLLDADVFKGCSLLGGLLVVAGTQVQPPLPSIVSFAATSDFVGNAVEIFGTGFDPMKANNIVKFNGVTTTVTSSTATTIIATVPVGATTGSISVTTNGMTATSASSFIVLSTPSISSFSPLQGPVGTAVTLTGTNFSTTPATNLVSFNGVSAVVTTSTATSITTMVPAGATTGPIAVSVNGVSATSATNFTVSVTTGDIQTNSGKSGIKVFPNPANTEITIGLEGLEKGKDVQINIYDGYGKQLDKRSGVGGQAITLDVRHYNIGNYVVKAVQGSNHYSLKFVKE